MWVGAAQLPPMFTTPVKNLELMLTLEAGG